MANKGVPIKFGPEVREEYLGYLRSGSLKHESAKRAGVSYRTIQRYRNADPDFKEEEMFAIAEACEQVEKVVYDLALDGDLKAADMWLKAHNRSVYNPNQTVTIDATDAAVEMSRNEAMARLAAAEAAIDQRRAIREESGHVIEASHTPVD